MLSSALLGSKRGLEGTVRAGGHRDDGRRDGLRLRIPSVSLKEARNIGLRIEQDVFTSLVNIQAIVEGQEPGRGGFTRTLRLSGHKVINVRNELENGRGIRTCNGEIVDLTTGKNTYASNLTRVEIALVGGALEAQFTDKEGSDQTLKASTCSGMTL